MSASRPQRLYVDPERCQGHNRCKLLAPSLFVLDSLGRSQAAGDGIVPPDLAERARLAVSNCPEFAISLNTTNVP